jgi:hypothetical protein
VRGIDALRKSFEEIPSHLPFDPLPALRDEGLILGHGTVLARVGRNRRGETSLALHADEERLLALLSTVFGRPVSPRVMYHVARASQQWRRGDKVLANIELASARFPRIETKEDAFRLLLAEDLLGGLAFNLIDAMTGNVVHFDGCKYSNGRMQEYKGHYADLLKKEFFTEAILKDDFIDQAKRQLRANNALNARTGRNNPVDWRFAALRASDRAAEERDRRISSQRRAFLWRRRMRLHHRQSATSRCRAPHRSGDCAAQRPAVAARRRARVSTSRNISRCHSRQARPGI